MLKIIKEFSCYLTSFSRVCSSNQFGGISTNIMLDHIKRKPRPLQISSNYLKPANDEISKTNDETPETKIEIQKEDIEVNLNLYSLF
jgi:hypothetical protein